jgi:glycosyltransferase involved in cell wall biosynthesis
MRRADIFLFPSILEGNPQVLLQASACGLPSIAMALYQSDYVLNGRTGFLVRSDAELSACLDRLVDDAGLRRSFATAAADHAREFDWDDIAKQWASVFEEVLQKRRPYRPTKSIVKTFLRA